MLWRLLDEDWFSPISHPSLLCPLHLHRNEWEPPDKKVDTRKYRAEPKSIFEYEPGKSSVLKLERTVCELPVCVSASVSSFFYVHVVLSPAHSSYTHTTLQLPCAHTSVSELLDGSYISRCMCSLIGHVRYIPKGCLVSATDDPVWLQGEYQLQG